MKNSTPIILILLSLAIIFFLVKPAFSEMGLAQDEEQNLVDLSRQITQTLEVKNKLLANLNSIPQEERQRLDTFLPTRTEVVRLIATIDSVASRHGISLEQAALNATKPDSERDSGVPKPKSYYDSEVIALSFSSNYASMTSFLEDLEKSLRVVDILSIEVGGGGDGVNAKGAVYKYTVTMEAYFLSDTENKI